MPVAECAVGAEIVRVLLMQGITLGDWFAYGRHLVYRVTGGRIAG